MDINSLLPLLLNGKNGASADAISSILNSKQGAETNKSGGMNAELLSSLMGGGGDKSQLLTSLLGAQGGGGGGGANMANIMSLANSFRPKNADGGFMAIKTIAPADILGMMVKYSLSLK